MHNGKFHVQREKSLALIGKLPDNVSMTLNPNISETVVRANLIEHVDAFLELSGKSDSFVGEQSIKDSKFISRVRAGDNFTLRTYQRVLDWLDSAEASA